jgi:hypothetical protein
MLNQPVARDSGFCLCLACLSKLPNLNVEQAIGLGPQTRLRCRDCGGLALVSLKLLTAEQAKRKLAVVRKLKRELARLPTLQRRGAARGQRKSRLTSKARSRSRIDK